MEDLSVATSCNDGSYQDRCPKYIPENIFYRLAMKAKNETAERFQAWIADEVIPSIRKSGMYEWDVRGQADDADGTGSLERPAAGRAGKTNGGSGRSQQGS